MFEKLKADWKADFKRIANLSFADYKPTYDDEIARNRPEIDFSLRNIFKWAIMPWTFPTLSRNIPKREDGRCRRCLMEPADTELGDCWDCHHLWSF